MTGGLHLAVMLRAGVVRAARLRSARPVALCQTMLGRSAQHVPAAFERLYGICGRSHRIAASLALRAARGQDTPEAMRRTAMVELAAERVGEHLRSTFITAVARGMATEPGELAALRDALAATRAGASGDGLARPLDGLGFTAAAIRRDSWADRMLDMIGPDDGSAAPVDALSAADDKAVLAALAAEGTAYAARPHLPQRRPETGPPARARGTGAPRARLDARFAEIRRAAALLRGAAGGDPDEWVADGALADGTGYAVVETPRGRMHHLMAVDRQDRVAGCAVLAPTEWNFHPDGPLVHALLGLRTGGGAAAEARIRWLIGLFDPCVGCALEVQEGGDA